MSKGRGVGRGIGKERDSEGKRDYWEYGTGIGMGEGGWAEMGVGRKGREGRHKERGMGEGMEGEMGGEGEKWARGEKVRGMGEERDGKRDVGRGNGDRDGRGERRGRNGRRKGHAEKGRSISMGKQEERGWVKGWMWKGRGMVDGREERG
ncbi:rRNA/tRNA 2'-O-methyltransferase fibrillarin-like protein 1 [Saccostrea cucullata]|uniref:rRNA/tRNA 2'-O-methyltransferase fibrillarin-like protein 1 n=1 Tax=Saccostrea cuccullata TaxID=36930 RepID=UPI002ED6B2A3